MNILHLQNEINIACGVSKTIYLIFKNTDEKINHHLICLGGDGLIRFERLGSHPIVILYNRFSVSGTIKIFFYLYRFCKKNNIDIIHSHHRYFDLLSFVIGKLVKIKTVMSVQSKVYGLKHFSYKSDILIACSETIKNHLINYFHVNNRNIKVINNFVDPDETNIGISKENLKVQLNIDRNAFILGFFGRYSNKEKGIDLLLKALNISKDLNNIYLILVGDGEDKRYINNFIINNKLRASIIPSAENIYDYYNICEVVILPSRIEPFGIVTIEAGLMKKAFIGSDVDGIKEIIKDNKNGLLFEKNNSNELAEKIKLLFYENELRKNLGKNLYKDVITKFSKKITLPLYEKIYSDLLK